MFIWRPWGLWRLSLSTFQVHVYSWISSGSLDHIFLSLNIPPMTSQPTAQSVNTYNLAIAGRQIFTFLISALYSLLCTSIFFNSSYFSISSWLSCLHVALTDSKLYVWRKYDHMLKNPEAHRFNYLTYFLMSKNYLKLHLPPQIKTHFPFPQHQRQLTPIQAFGDTFDFRVCLYSFPLLKIKRVIKL